MTSRIWAWGWAKEKYFVQKLGKEILNTLALQVMDIKFLPLIWICLHFSLHCIFPHLWFHEETTILEIRRLLKKNKYSSEKSVASSAEREFWELDWNWVPAGISLLFLHILPLAPLAATQEAATPSDRSVIVHSVSLLMEILLWRLLSAPHELVPH